MLEESPCVEHRGWGADQLSGGPMGWVRAAGSDSRQEVSRAVPELLGRAGACWTRPASRTPRMQINLDMKDNHRKKGDISLVDFKLSYHVSRKFSLNLCRAIAWEDNDLHTKM